MCRVPGTVYGVAPGVVPEHVVCGNCGNIANYQPSRYELIAQDYEGDLTTPFYLSPDRRTSSSLLCPNCGQRHHNGSPVNGADVYRCLKCGEMWKHPQENPQDQPIKRMHTRQLLQLLSFGGYAGGPHENISEDVLRAELATREHIPNKKEGRELRRRLAQGRPRQSREEKMAGVKKRGCDDYSKHMARSDNPMRNREARLVWEQGWDEGASKAARKRAEREAFMQRVREQEALKKSAEGPSPVPEEKPCPPNASTSSRVP